MRTINGYVIADDDHLPIPGASVKVLSTNFSDITNQNGHFTIQAPESVTRLTVSFIGFDTREITIDPNISEPYHVIMKSTSYVLGGAIVGGVVVVRKPFFKRIYYRLIKKPIHKVFN